MLRPSEYSEKQSKAANQDAAAKKLEKLAEVGRIIKPAKTTEQTKPTARKAAAKRHAWQSGLFSSQQAQQIQQRRQFSSKENCTLKQGPLEPKV